MLLHLVILCLSISSIRLDDGNDPQEMLVLNTDASRVLLLVPIEQCAE